MSEIAGILGVTSMLHERALEAYRQDRAEEDRLQAELDRIDGLRQAMCENAASLDARRLLGADTLWQGWLSRRRGEINRAIAMSRARQANSLARSREAFSRNAAAQEIAEQEARDRRRCRLLDEERKLELLSVLRSFDTED